MAITNVSCEADRRYVETLAMLAKKHKVSQGRLVRQAIDAVYGKELADVERRMSIFFEEESASEFKSALEGTNA